MRVILKVTLSLGHALTLYSLSNLKLSVGIKWDKLSNKIGYQFTRPAEFYCDKTWFNEEDAQQWGVAKPSPKLGVKLLCSFLLKLQHIKLSLVHTQHWDGYGNGNTYMRGNCCLCFYRSSSALHVSLITWQSDFS
jgi:hypothetical protein